MGLCASVHQDTGGSAAAQEAGVGVKGLVGSPAEEGGWTPLFQSPEASSPSEGALPAADSPSETLEKNISTHD